MQVSVVSYKKWSKNPKVVGLETCSNVKKYVIFVILCHLVIFDHFLMFLMFLIIFLMFSLDNLPPPRPVFDVFSCYVFDVSDNNSYLEVTIF